MKQINLYKRNSIGNPILWYIAQDDRIITTKSGLVLGESFHRSSSYVSEEAAIKEFNSKVTKKRKEGYKEVHELYDNAPNEQERDIVAKHIRIKFETFDQSLIEDEALKAFLNDILKGE